MDKKEVDDSLARGVAAWVLDTAQEWMRYAKLEPAGDRVRAEWHRDGGQEWLRVQQVESGHARDFTVSVQAFPYVVPPIGPEAADELIWVPRTWVDVRPGDTIRMPGTEHTAYVQTAVHLRWHVDPRSSEYQPAALDWSAVRVRLLPDADHVKLADAYKAYDMDPAKPIEIQLSKHEVEALDIEECGIGWADRLGMVQQ